jgi:hypothetical protein
MKNTDNAVGENTSMRTAIIYKATHPNVEGIYVGCKLDSLDNYYTSSNCFDEAVALTGVKPTLEAIDVLEVDWNVEENRQIPYQREREVYDLLKEMGATMLNGSAPSGYCPYVYPIHKGKNLTNAHKTKISENHARHMLGKTHSEETKAKISEKKIGKTHSEETKAKISKNNARNMLGKDFTVEHKAKISQSKKGKTTAAHRKVISMLDGRVTAANQVWRYNKKNPDYIGTWVDL